MMAKPIAPVKGVAFAFPDVCKTPTPGGAEVPLPYPNIAQLSEANKVSCLQGKELKVGPAGDHVLLAQAVIESSKGDEAGTGGGVVKIGTTTGGACTLVGASATVLYGPDGLGIVRFLDRTEQNGGNAQGVVLSALPSILVGD